MTAGRIVRHTSRTCEPARASQESSDTPREVAGEGHVPSAAGCLRWRVGGAGIVLTRGFDLSRRLAALVAVALLCAAVLPQTIAAAGPTGGKLSKQDRALIAEAAVTGKASVTVLIAARPGAVKTVASGLAALGATVRYREDSIDYIRATIAGDKVAAAAQLRGVQALEVDSLIPLPDPRPDGQTVPIPFPAPDASTPRANPYMPIADTGAAAFTAAHPTWDGRGVTVGVLDLGISLDHPALATTTTGSPKIVDWVTYTASDRRW